MDDIPFQPNLPKLLRKLRVKEDTRYAKQIECLLDEAQAIARPRAMYRVAYVDSRDEDSVVIGGVRFHSRVLRVNLDSVHRVFPFVVTGGTELHEWMQAQDDMLLRYYADVISETALRQASAMLKAHLVRRYALGRTSTMSPGSLEDWPIQEQRPLFALLGDLEQAIGVRLTDSMLMIPSKSVSGIRFPVEKTFESCQLCQRERCPSRKAPYDPDLYARRYRPEMEAASEGLR
ncbi:MAG TPA: vitamin B12 dependent methionine synthase [Chloroflexi bacterium]|nr:vitamin B12 dependent methionine synthase [Chloroflexota bacterium]